MKKTKLLLFLLILILLTFTIIVLVLMNIGIIPTIFKKGEKVKNKDISSDVSKNETQKPSGELGKVDDWCFDPEEYVEETSKSIFSSSITSADAMLESATTNSLGLSVGGAKDVNNFRENIENDYFPLQSDITYEGIYYDYSFDTGNEGKEVDKMFYPTYSTAISKDPFSDNQEYYVWIKFKY